MGARNITFSELEHYHCYNRGTEKRKIFLDQQDYIYFIKSLRAYNSLEVRGKLRLHDNDLPASNPPVTILAYCLLPNHYHLILRNNIEDGVSKYLQRVLVGYTMYFNKKYDRSGSLFQGQFKAKHAASDQDVRQLLAYVSQNHKIHDVSDKTLYRSSLNTNDSLVQAMSANTKNLKEIVEIIKEQRLSF